MATLKDLQTLEYLPRDEIACIVVALDALEDRISFMACSRSLTATRRALGGVAAVVGNLSSIQRVLWFERALRLGKSAYVTGLVDVGCDPNGPVPFGLDQGLPLTLAANHGHELCTRALLTKGSDPENSGYDGLGSDFTALMCATRRGHHPCVVALLEWGCSVDRTDNAGVSALLHGAQFGHDVCVSALLDKGSDPDQKEVSGWTALMFAAAHGHEMCVEALLAKRCDFEQTNFQGNTALMIAARHGHKGIVCQLLKAKSNPNKVADDGYTALLEASELGHEAVVCALLSAGSDPNTACAHDGVTALILAAQNGHDGIVRALLEARSDLDKANNEGWTALMLAAQFGHDQCSRDLRRVGTVRSVNDGATNQQSCSHIICITPVYGSIPSSFTRQP